METSLLVIYGIIILIILMGISMKEYKISYFRLNLVLLGYLLYNVIYFLLDYSAGAAGARKRTKTRCAYCHLYI